MPSDGARFRQAVREVQLMFGTYGNYEDYWLGTPRDNTSAQEGWLTIELYIRVQRQREAQEWTPERDRAERMLREAPRQRDRAGGLVGLGPNFHRIRNALMRRGMLMLPSAEAFGMFNHGLERL